MSDLVITPQGRGSYPSLLKSRRNRLSGKDEFSIELLFPPDVQGNKAKEIDAHPQFLELQRIVADAMEEKFKVRDFKSLPKSVKKNFRMPFKDQADKAYEDDDGNEAMPDGHFAGAIYLRLKNTKQPGVVGKDGKIPITNENEIYGGAYYKCVVSAYAYDHESGNRGVNFSLEHVQKVGEGDSFGAPRTNPEDHFSAVPEEEGEDEAAPADVSGETSHSIFG